MKHLSFLLLCLLAAFSSEAKIWRVNNNPGVTADFATFVDAVNAAAAGDTIHLEPSATDYTSSSLTLAKRLVVIGPGYFLDPANTSTPGNAGLQFATGDGRIPFFRIASGANGSKFMGITISGSVYMNGVSNISFEKVYFPASPYFETGTNDAVSFRKCFFNGVGITAAATTVISNFTCENSIFYNSAYISLATLSGSGNLVRNNSVLNSGSAFLLANTYLANNIFGTSAQGTFTNCTVKNNLFQSSQTLPGTAVGNVVSVTMTNVYVGGTTGSLDSRAVLKAGSPAIAAGLTVGTVTTPDCGAFGATDPYKLSGIPNVPSIYSLTVPTSIPSGSATMNISFSTRNNN